MLKLRTALRAHSHGGVGLFVQNGGISINGVVPIARPFNKGQHLRANG